MKFRIMVTDGAGCYMQVFDEIEAANDRAAVRKFKRQVKNGTITPTRQYDSWCKVEAWQNL